MRNVCLLFVCAVSLSLLLSCGSSSGNDPYTPAPPPPPPPADTSWTEVAGILAANCGKCHNGTVEPAFSTGAIFKASLAKNKLIARTMPPPPATIADADKAKLLSYLNAP